MQADYFIGKAKQFYFIKNTKNDRQLLFDNTDSFFEKLLEISEKRIKCTNLNIEELNNLEEKLGLKFCNSCRMNITEHMKYSSYVTTDGNFKENEKIICESCDENGLLSC
jgi:transcription-repair coupling factor (superfamily II helicase)